MLQANYRDGDALVMLCMKEAPENANRVMQSNATCNDTQAARGPNQQNSTTTLDMASV